jgi:hypothetical protein
MHLAASIPPEVLNGHVVNASAHGLVPAGGLKVIGGASMELPLPAALLFKLGTILLCPNTTIYILAFRLHGAMATLELVLHFSRLHNISSIERRGLDTLRIERLTYCCVKLYILL